MFPFFLNLCTLVGMLASIMLLFSSSNIIFFVVILELNGVLSMLIIFLNNKNQITESSIFIFLINVVILIFFVWGVCINSENLILTAFYLKLSFFPFVWWFPYVSDSLSSFLFFTLGIIQKIIPLVFVYCNECFSFDSTILFAICNVVISLINLTYNQNNLYVFLAWSSNVNFSWTLIFFFDMWAWGFSYLFFYSLILSLCLVAIRLKVNYWDQICSSNWGISSTSFIGLLSFAGIPPMLGFYYKVIFFSIMTTSSVGTGIIYCLICLFFFTWNSYVYINMVFKLKLESVDYTPYNYILVCFLIGFCFLSVFSIFI